MQFQERYLLPLYHRVWRGAVGAAWARWRRGAGGQRLLRAMLAVRSGVDWRVTLPVPASAGGTGGTGNTGSTGGMGGTGGTGGTCNTGGTDGTDGGGQCGGMIGRGRGRSRRDAALALDAVSAMVARRAILGAPP